jgi:hypothetical protein
MNKTKKILKNIFEVEECEELKNEKKISRDVKEDDE